MPLRDASRQVHCCRRCLKKRRRVGRVTGGAGSYASQFCVVARINQKAQKSRRCDPRNTSRFLHLASC